MLRALLRISIFVVVCMHLLLLYTGHIPVSAAIFGLVMQAVYSRSLQDYPNVNFKSFRFFLTSGEYADRNNMQSSSPNFSLEFYLTVGAFVHKYIWFTTSLFNDDSPQTDSCFCLSSICFCIQPILFLFTCVWMVPFILVVTWEPAEEQPKHGYERKHSDTPYERSAASICLQSAKDLFSKAKSNSYRIVSLM